ncbi:hypothetical protein ACHQM5_025154 [Ranunculus cassubicifolius]
MDESIFSADKEVLVAVVKMAQKEKRKGDKGDWKKFLDSHDKKLGHSISDPAKRSNDDLIAFLKTFSKEEDFKFFAKMAGELKDRKSVADLANNSAEDESPQQRLVRLTLQHPDFLLNYSFPTKNEDWVATELGKPSKAVKMNSMVAVDCEMVLCQDGTEAVVKVCVVDENLEVKLNELVNPNKPVADYRTGITGISASDLKDVTCSLAHIQKKMKRLLRRGTILIGHGLNNDLRALKLDHARVIDTSYIFDTPTRKRSSLNDLCKTVLGYEVRKVGAPHNCLDDARAAMKLILAKLEKKVEDTTPGSEKLVDDTTPGSEKLVLHGIQKSIPQEELLRVFPGFTYELQTRNTLRKHQKQYSVEAVFKSSDEANQAFENVKGNMFKDCVGHPQKHLEFELSTGLPATLSVRKTGPTPSAKPEDGKSKKRSNETDNANENDSKKAKIECEEHIVEIERLKTELRQKDDEIANLQKILAAFARKQGL